MIRHPRLSLLNAAIAVLTLCLTFLTFQPQAEARPRLARRAVGFLFCRSCSTGHQHVSAPTGNACNGPMCQMQTAPAPTAPKQVIAPAPSPSPPPDASGPLPPR